MSGIMDIALIFISKIPINPKVSNMTTPRNPTYTKIKTEEYIYRVNHKIMLKSNENRVFPWGGGGGGDSMRLSVYP